MAASLKSKLVFVVKYFLKDGHSDGGWIGYQTNFNLHFLDGYGCPEDFSIYFLAIYISAKSKASKQ